MELTKQLSALNATVQNDARRFAEFDADHNQQMSFDEFVELLPRATRGRFAPADLRAWFDSADTDHSGMLSVDEFFVWSLRNASVSLGGEENVLQTIFGKYDTRGTGYLSPAQFQNACDDIGFGLMAHNIFRSLDANHSGFIQYAELMNMMQLGSAGMGTEAKQMLSMISSSYAAETKGQQRLGAALTKSWTISERGGVAGVKSQIRHLVATSGLMVTDLLHKFDPHGAGNLIDLEEFRTCMRDEFGYSGQLGVLDAVFHDLDTDQSGEIGFDELYEFLRGLRHSLDARNKRVSAMSMHPPEGSTYTLDEVVWDQDSLRLMMLQMMERACVGTSDVMKAWDRTGDGQLNEKEFLHELASFFAGHEDLWEAEVKAVAAIAFRKVGYQRGESRVKEVKLSSDELERWICDAPADVLDREPPLKPRRPVSRGRGSSKPVSTPSSSSPATGPVHAARGGDGLVLGPPSPEPRGSLQKAFDDAAGMADDATSPGPVILPPSMMLKSVTRAPAHYKPRPRTPMFAMIHEYAVEWERTGLPRPNTAGGKLPGAAERYGGLSLAACAPVEFK